jgi:uracil-DNA glycosylase
MGESKAKLLTSLRQLVEADRCFGLRDVPFVLPAFEPTGRSSGGGASVGASGDGAGDVGLLLGGLDDGQVKSCTACALCETRTRTVFGVGSPRARLVFVGEAPGFEEDRRGVPFVGRAGEMLDRIVVAMGLSRDLVYICNVLKCRPPNNRDPAAEEILTCSPYLFQQLAWIRPEVIVALGAPAARTLLNSSDSIGRLRGRFHEFRLPGEYGVAEPIPLMPTYHPAYLLRTPSEKRKSWSDLQLVMKRMGLIAPGRTSD